MKKSFPYNGLHVVVDKDESWEQARFFQDDKFMNQLASVSRILYGDTWYSAIISNTGYAESDTSYFRSMIEALQACIRVKNLMEADKFQIWFEKELDRIEYMKEGV